MRSVFLSLSDNFLLIVFLLYQLILKGTNAGLILLSRNTVPADLGIYGKGNKAILSKRSI